MAPSGQQTQRIENLNAVGLSGNQRLIYLYVNLSQVLRRVRVVYQQNETGKAAEYRSTENRP